jgi:hypothetical protein
VLRCEKSGVSRLREGHRSVSDLNFRQTAIFENFYAEFAKILAAMLSLLQKMLDLRGAAAYNRPQPLT